MFDECWRYDTERNRLVLVDDPTEFVLCQTDAPGFIEFRQASQEPCPLDFVMSQMGFARETRERTPVYRDVRGRGKMKDSVSIYIQGQSTAAFHWTIIRVLVDTWEGGRDFDRGAL